MMKGLPKKIGTLKYTLITILILLIPIGYYFFFHVPSQKAYFTSRNLRLLGDMSKHISEKISSYKSTIDNVVIKNESIKNTIKEKLNKTIPDSLIKKLLENNVPDSLKEKKLSGITSKIDTFLQSDETIKDFIKTRIDEIQNLELEENEIRSGFGLATWVKQLKLDSTETKNSLSHFDSLIFHHQFSHIKLGLELNKNIFVLHMHYLGWRVDEK